MIKLADIQAAVEDFYFLESGELASKRRAMPLPEARALYATIAHDFFPEYKEEIPGFLNKNRTMFYTWTDNGRWYMKTVKGFKTAYNYVVNQLGQKNAL